MAITPSNDMAAVDKTDVEDPQKKKNRVFRDQVAACKSYRQKLIPNWTDNVDYRRGKPFTSYTDQDRVTINLDWSITIAKQSQLFSQVPMVFVNHSPETTSDEAMSWVHDFQTRINDTLRVAGIESAMYEILPDCINAAGFGAVLVARETITRNVDLPAVDLGMLPPDIQQMVLQTGALPDGTPIPMEVVPETIDARYVVSRISPEDFLWPIDFTGSDFDNAPWIGRTGTLTWPEAKLRFNLTDEDKEKVVGDDKTTVDRIVNDVEKERFTDEKVTFDEIFYKEHACSDTPRGFQAIRHLVFVGGMETPVIDEPWKGQDTDEMTGLLIGALRYPIRVLTLTYLTNEPLPPSDSSIIRSQVNELSKSRTQIMLQRERSLPITSVDATRVDPLILHSLMKGVVQHIIPVQGQGEVIQEVKRAGHPPDNFTFDDVIKADVLEMARVGPEPGVDGPQQKEQSPMGSMRTRIAMDRARVGKFFCTVAEVVGGLLCLYEPPESMPEGFTPTVSRSLGYSILADSTVLLDSQQRLKMLSDFLDLSAKSGWMDIPSVLREIATLSGLDPAVVIRPPEPTPPPAPNISLRLTGTEDMLNPLTLAFMMKAGMAPDTAMIEEAKELITAAVTPPPGAAMPMMMPGMDPSMPPDPNAPPLPPTDPNDPTGGAAPSVMLPVGPPHVPQAVTPPDMPPPAPGDANPNWSKLPHLDKRKIDHPGTEG